MTDSEQDFAYVANWIRTKFYDAITSTDFDNPPTREWWGAARPYEGTPMVLPDYEPMVHRLRDLLIEAEDHVLPAAARVGLDSPDFPARTELFERVPQGLGLLADGLVGVGGAINAPLETNAPLRTELRKAFRLIDGAMRNQAQSLPATEHGASRVENENTHEPATVEPEADERPPDDPFVALYHELRLVNRDNLSERQWSDAVHDEALARGILDPEDPDAPDAEAIRKRISRARDRQRATGTI